MGGYVCVCVDISLGKVAWLNQEAVPAAAAQ